VVFGELGNFPLWGLIWGTAVVLGGFGGIRQFSFMAVDLGHCVGGFSWFWGVRQFSFMGVDLGHCATSPVGGQQPLEDVSK
jgi:hypothetical protein